jgi:hypothetical protein
MNSLNAKIVWVALGFVVLATPALAQTRHHHPQYNGATQSAPVQQYPAPDEHYPNGTLKSGSGENFDSGAEFNVGQ